MNQVSSTAIKAIAYNEAKHTLIVDFTSGGTYEYEGVPSNIYQAFEAAPSKGSFFHQNILDRYLFTKLS